MRLLLELEVALGTQDLAGVLTEGKAVVAAVGILQL